MFTNACILGREILSVCERMIERFRKCARAVKDGHAHDFCQNVRNLVELVCECAKMRKLLLTCTVLVWKLSEY